jgi:hypothetical protein
MNGEIDAKPEVVSPGRTKLQQFFNGTVTPYDQSQKPVDVTWRGFPNLVRLLITLQSVLVNFGIDSTSISR